MVKYGRVILVLAAVMVGSAAIAEQPAKKNSGLQLSPPLMALLRAEMRELQAGMQQLSTSIAIADWEGIAKTGQAMRRSYILNRKLTDAQRNELKSKLPDHFKRLDAAFHEEAGRLEAVARKHDAQLAAFHYYQLLETCTACHAQFAAERFPGFSATADDAHGH